MFQKKLQGDVKTGKYARDECAVLCSEDRRTTACEYDIVKRQCTVHTKTVTSSFTPLGLDNNQRCAIILPKAVCKCGVERTRITRIARGRKVKLPGKYPWMARLLYKPMPNFNLCGGTLIATQWVMTAAHCCSNFKNSPFGDQKLTHVVLGEHDYAQINEQDTNLHRTVIEIESEFCKPEFDWNEAWQSDIALLKLKEEADISIHTPACLPVQVGEEYYMGMAALMMGWGYTDVCRKNSAKILQEIDMRTITNLECEAKSRIPALYERWDSVNGQCINTTTTGVFPIDHTNMCAMGEVHLGGGTCLGDSGGPLTVKDPLNDPLQDQHELVGVTSGGPGCGRGYLLNAKGEVYMDHAEGWPSVFVNVNSDEVKKWRNKIIDQNGGAIYC